MLEEMNFTVDESIYGDRGGSKNPSNVVQSEDDDKQRFTAKEESTFKTQEDGSV